MMQPRHATQLQPVPEHPELVYSLCGHAVPSERLAPERGAVSCLGCRRVLALGALRERRQLRAGAR